MTENKPIIIDGVPVQDCCYFDYENDGYEDSCYIHQNECSAQNCYFKQLHHYKQVVKDVKSLAIRLRGRCGQLVPYEIKQIIQKCEEVNK